LAAHLGSDPDQAIEEEVVAPTVYAGDTDQRRRPPTLPWLLAFISNALMEYEIAFGQRGQTLTSVNPVKFGYRFGQQSIIDWLLNSVKDGQPLAIPSFQPINLAGAIRDAARVSLVRAYNTP
jgi:hypothetical protein